LIDENKEWHAKQICINVYINRKYTVFRVKRYKKEKRGYTKEKGRGLYFERRLCSLIGTLIKEVR
jgi:hypothetical protein